jgi:tetratricopeptide (TPR) repeat protein
VCEREHQARARAAERVADGDRTTVRIDAPVRRIDAPAVEAGQRLRRERLVELDDVDVLVSAARTIIRDDRARALEMLLRAADAAWWSGRLDRAAELGTLAAAVPLSDRDDEAFMVDLLIGVAEVLHGNFDRGAEALRRALAIADAFNHSRYLLPAAHGAVYIGDDHAAHRFLERSVASLRAAGAIGDLPGALEFLAGIDLWRGHLSTAAANAFEALRLATDAGQETTRAYLLALIASIDSVRGDEEACRARAREALDIALRRSLVLHATLARCALGRLELGLGRCEQALDHFAAVADDGPERRTRSCPSSRRPDIVEAAIRCGEFEHAATAMRRLDACAARTRSSWSLA